MSTSRRRGDDADAQPADAGQRWAAGDEKEKSVLKSDRIVGNPPNVLRDVLGRCSTAASLILNH